jgi:hypothetical protein
MLHNLLPPSGPPQFGRPTVQRIALHTAPRPRLVVPLHMRGAMGQVAPA